MSVISVRASLLTKLQQMQTLKTAFDYEASNSNGKYPFATLTLREGDGETVSNQWYLRKRGFRIRIYQERSKVGQGSEQAEYIIANVVDELETAYDMDLTLSGTVKYVRPISWSASYLDRELDTRLLEIEVDAYEMASSDP